MSDVTVCFNSLKKVVQELHSISGAGVQLQMAQPSVKCVDIPYYPRDAAVTSHAKIFGADFGSGSSHGFRNGV